MAGVEIMAVVASRNKRKERLSKERKAEDEEGKQEEQTTGKQSA
jgi:hypothetical protein